jgi:dTDP-4-amino-4,6-dideoxygalactose transaminase
VIAEEDVAAVLDCLRSGWLTMGPRIHAFEEALAAELGVPHAIAVSSGAAALQLALTVSGAQEGTDVIVPAIGSVDATAAARATRAAVVACDGALHADAGDAAGRIGDRTRAVVVSHAFGFPAELGGLADACEARGVALVEDATVALGLGTPIRGAARCVSFAPGSPVAVGEGGAVLCADDAFAKRVRSLRSHAMTSVTWDRHRGHAETYDIVDVGFNYRMDEARAALATSELARLAQENRRRRDAVHALTADLGLAGLVPVDLAAADAAAPAALPVLAPSGAEREALHDRLVAAGHVVDAGPWLTVPAAAVPPAAADAAGRLLAVRLA